MSGRGHRVPRRSQPALQGRVVLLVEDEALIVLDMTHALERAGARVLSAASATQALARLAGAMRPDAAVLDLRLRREGDSVRVAARLDALGVPFLLHTGDALRQGALIEQLGVPVLHKTYPSHHLAERVAELLGAPGPAGPSPVR